MSITLAKILLAPAIGVLLLLHPLNITAQCTASGPLSAGTASSISFAGSDFNFNNANNVFTSDNNRASSTGLLTLFIGETEYLKATNFGFNIPLTALICGIVVEVEKSATGIGTVAGIGLSYVTDYSVRLVKNGATAGNNKATSTHWTSTEAYDTYGGANDIWGIAWTPADINASNFGIAFASSINGLAMLIPNVRIDHIRITVYYNVTILPANILSFHVAVRNNHTATIDWKTPVEKVNSTYSVERSPDGRQWETVRENIDQSFQAGKLSFFMEDKQPYSGESFYRLRIAAASGETVYSPIRSVRIGSNTPLTVYPNPFTDRLFLSNRDRKEKITITDLGGRLIAISKVANVLYLYSLKPGIYLLQVGKNIMKVQKE